VDSSKKVQLEIEMTADNSDVRRKIDEIQKAPQSFEVKLGLDTQKFQDEMRKIQRFAHDSSRGNVRETYSTQTNARVVLTRQPEIRIENVPKTETPATTVATSIQDFRKSGARAMTEVSPPPLPPKYASSEGEKKPKTADQLYEMAEKKAVEHNEVVKMADKLWEEYNKLYDEYDKSKVTASDEELAKMDDDLAQREALLDDFDREVKSLKKAYEKLQDRAKKAEEAEKKAKEEENKKIQEKLEEAIEKKEKTQLPKKNPPQKPSVKETPKYRNWQNLLEENKKAYYDLCDSILALGDEQKRLTEERNALISQRENYDPDSSGNEDIHQIEEQMGRNQAQIRDYGAKLNDIKNEQSISEGKISILEIKERKEQVGERKRRLEDRLKNLNGRLANVGENAPEESEKLQTEIARTMAKLVAVRTEFQAVTDESATTIQSVGEKIQERKEKQKATAKKAENQEIEDRSYGTDQQMISEIFERLERVLENHLSDNDYQTLSDNFIDKTTEMQNALNSVMNERGTIENTLEKDDRIDYFRILPPTQPQISLPRRFALLKRLPKGPPDAEFSYRIGIVKQVQDALQEMYDNAVNMINEEATRTARRDRLSSDDLLDPEKVGEKLRSLNDAIDDLQKKKEKLKENNAPRKTTSRIDRAIGTLRRNREDVEWRAEEKQRKEEENSIVAPRFLRRLFGFGSGGSGGSGNSGGSGRIPIRNVQGAIRGVVNVTSGIRRGTMSLSSMASMAGKALKALSALGPRGVAIGVALAAAFAGVIVGLMKMCERLKEAAELRKTFNSLNNEVKILGSQMMTLGYISDDMINQFVNIQVEAEKTAWANRFLTEADKELEANLMEMRIAWGTFSGCLGDVTTEIVNGLFPILEFLGNFLSVTFGGILKGFYEWWIMIKDALSAVGDVIAPLMEKLKPLGDFLGKTLGSAFRGLANPVATIGKALGIRYFENVGKRADDFVTKNAEQAREKEMPTVNFGPWQKLQTLLNGNKKASTESLTSAYDRINNAVANRNPVVDAIYKQMEAEKQFQSETRDMDKKSLEYQEKVRAHNDSVAMCLSDIKGMLGRFNPAMAAVVEG